MRTPSKVYILENEEQCYMSQTDESMLRNRRMGHLNFENMVNVSQTKIGKGLSKIFKHTNNIYKSCQI